MDMLNLVTTKQAFQLKELGFDTPVSAYSWLKEDNLNIYHSIPENWNKEKMFLSRPTVDEAIDWLRKKHHIMVYNYAAPFVDPTTGRILFAFKVKQCNPITGWNFRIHIGETKWMKNINAAKRAAVTKSISYLKKQKSYGKN